MHAIRLHAFGPPENLVLDELPDLSPAPGEVRIAVEASGVHLLDTTIRSGEPGPLPPPELPTVPGREVAGVVDEVGPDADRTWLDSRVVAHLGQVPGGYAEQAVTTVDKLFRVPDHVSFPDAVAAVGTGRTALGVVELEPADRRTTWSSCRRPRAGWAGCWCSRPWRPVRRWSRRPRATATEALAGLGAHLVVDYAEPGWDEKVRAETGGVSLVYDGVGGELGRQSLELLRPGGRLVMFGFSAGAPTQLTTDDLIGRGISAGWSLGARMVALPGGIPGLAGPGAGQGGGRRVAAARLDVPLVGRGPGARRPGGPPGARQGRAGARAPMNSVEVVGPHRQNRPIRKQESGMSEQAVGRRLPRALTPFRHAAYRRLAVALTLPTFASGVWVVALVWEVIRLDGGPAQLSLVSTAGAVGVLLPALLGGVVADRIPQKLILLVVAGVELAGMTLVAALSITDHTALWHLAAVSFVTGMGHGLLLPRLLRVAARAGARVRPDGGQRLRGHGPARRSARRSARPSPAPSSGPSRRVPPSRWRRPARCSGCSR